MAEKKGLEVQLELGPKHYIAGKGLCNSIQLHVVFNEKEVDDPTMWPVFEAGDKEGSKVSVPLEVGICELTLLVDMDMNLALVIDPLLKYKLILKLLQKGKAVVLAASVSEISKSEN